MRTSHLGMLVVLHTNLRIMCASIHCESLLHGVRQDAILRKNLSKQPSFSGISVRIDDILLWCYVDDLALIAELESDLQQMLDIISSYKSSILVLGETSRLRALRRPIRHWFIQGSSISEKDEQTHLQSVSHSTVHQTTQHCLAGRITFYALNAMGSRHGCLHPLTSYHLHTTLSIPILLYGNKLWCQIKSKSMMLE